MVFQFHHLFEHLTALHNVWLAPVHVLHQPRNEAERQALELLDQMGVGAQRASDAARVVRRRGSTCGDCSSAGHGPAVAPDG